MDDMNAFDRQLASVVLQRVGPSEPVDDAAIFSAIATASPEWRFGSMFSATKFVAAGVLVALFGGLLLAGMLTQPSDESMPAAGASASSTESAMAEATEGPSNATESHRHDILPGVDLEVKELQPGVLHVLGDGVRDLTSLPHWIVMQGDEGDIWLGDDYDLSVRLGEPETGARVTWEAGARPPSKWKQRGAWADGALERGGTLWLFELRPHDRTGLPQTSSVTRLERIDGDRSRECPLTGMPPGLHPVAVDEGGGLWGVYPVHETTTTDRLTGEEVVVQDLALARFDCKSWDDDFPPLGVMVLPDRKVSVADDGSVWALAVPMATYLEDMQRSVSEQSAPGAFPHELYVITRGAIATAEPVAVSPVEEGALTETATSRSDLLPGVDLVTEEVEPGVHRVLSDGIHNLSGRVRDLALSETGEVWLALGRHEDVNVVRLGGTERWPPQGDWDTGGLGVTRDGVVVFRRDGTTWVPDQETWAKADLSAYDECVLSANMGGWISRSAVGADESCWTQDSDNAVPVRIDADDARTKVTRADIGLAPHQSLGLGVTAAPDGTLWYPVQREDSLLDGLATYDGSSWSVIPFGSESRVVSVGYPVGVDADGVVWVPDPSDDVKPGGYDIWSWNGVSWTSHRIEAAAKAPPVPVRVWPNGILWFGPVATRWDGSTLSVVEAAVPEGGYAPLASAPDGIAWTVTDNQLFVITPEAVAAE